MNASFEVPCTQTQYGGFLKAYKTLELIESDIILEELPGIKHKTVCILHTQTRRLLRFL